MRKDPLFLSHLGELATLKNFLGCYYHEDTWDEFRTHEEVWDAALKGDSFDGIELLIEQMDEVLTWSAEKVHNFIYKEESGGLYLATPSDSVIWLKRCRDYMTNALIQKKKIIKEKI